MSGHSKWSTIKRQKQATDAARGQMFTKLASAITIAAREGGGPDPATNFRLRLAVDQARSANMPKENIERAIARATTQEKEGGLQEVTYEGFVQGVAILIVCVTDNTNRTAAEVKNLFTTHGGNLGGAGSVAYLFKRAGELKFPKKRPYDVMLELTLETGGEDLQEETDDFIVYTQPADLHKVKTAFEQKGIAPVSAELIFKPMTLIVPESEEVSQKITDFLEVLEELPDVQKVHTNI